MKPSAVARSSAAERAPPASRSCAPANEPLLTPQEAAAALGIRTTTLYGWLGLARVGALVLHGESVSLRFLQTGPRGQGRIRIPVSEFERLREHLLVQTRRVVARKPPMRQATFPGIHVPLGRPDQGA